MDEKGANTFPFHNLPPELKILKRSFLFFSPFPFYPPYSDDQCYRPTMEPHCDTVEELTVFWNAGLRFAFVFEKCRGKQESPPTFILSNKERKKAQKNSFFEIFLGFGG